MKDVDVNKEPPMLLIYLIIMLLPLQNFSLLVHFE